MPGQKSRILGKLNLQRPKKIGAERNIQIPPKKMKIGKTPLK